MTRKKVKLAFITNDSSRKATFKKRKKGLMKKVNELSTLCGITACAIIYSPYDTNPEVWPSNSGVQRVISEFRTLPEMDQHKKMVDQETFLTQRVGKALEQLKKQRKDNREMEMTEVMFQCLVGNMGLFNLNLIDLNDLGYLIEQYLKDINRRIEILGGNNNNNNNNYRLEIGESSNATSDEHKGGIGSLAVVEATTAPNAAAAIREVGSSSVAATSMFNPNNQQQFRYYEQQQQQQQVLPLDLNMRQADQNQQQQQQWFMEMMNNPEQMNYAAEQIGFPFMDHNHRYNMHHHHHQQQQQQEEEEQNSGDSATTAVTAAAASSSSTVPVTSSNLTNTLWFR
ncbi:unnamed protein product [Cochlearia groenlandica]